MPRTKANNFPSRDQPFAKIFSSTGMLADFLKDTFGMRDGDYVQTHIMENAEMFAQMWERAMKNGGKNVRL
jgi:hypothetical protein